MRRTTMLHAQWKADRQESPEYYLKFQNCKGGYLSSEEAHTLKITGQTRQDHLRGINLLGGLPLAQAIATALGSTATGTTVTYSGSAIHEKIIYEGPFQENTVYSIMLHGYGTGYSCNLGIRYTDGSVDSMASMVGYASYSARSGLFVTKPNKTVQALVGYNRTGSTTLYCASCGIFQGALTLDDFEVYCGGIPAPNPAYPKPIHHTQKMTNICVTGKNLLPQYKDGTYLINGVTFVWEGGVLTLNGTATGTIQHYVGSTPTIPGGVPVAMSGCPKGGTGSTYYMYDTYQHFSPNYDMGDGTTGTLAQRNPVGVHIVIASGYTCDHLVFKPMVEIGSAPTAFEPYRGTAFDQMPCELYDGDAWYPQSGTVVKRNAVIESYNGEPIESEYISTTGGLDIGATVVYKLSTPVLEQYTATPIPTYPGTVTVLQIPPDPSYYHSTTGILSLTMLTKRMPPVSPSIG